MAVRVVVAEDDYLVREGLEYLLGDDPRVELVGVYGSADELLEGLESDRPDVVVTDIRMPPRQLDEGIVLAEQLRSTHPSIGVVVVSNYAEPRHALRLFDAGADRRAYLLKQRVVSREGLVNVVLDVAAGGSAVDASVVDQLLAAHRASSPLDGLTPRELEVLGFVARGDSNERIAERLSLSKGAVERHINGIFGKLGLSQQADVSSRVMAALLYLGLGDST